MKNKKEIYDKVFKLYCSTDKLRPTLQNPFKQNGYYLATDAYNICMLKSDLIDLEYGELEKPDCMKWIGLINDNFKYSLSIAELKNKLIFKMIDDFEYEECKKCDGEGYEECDLGHEHDCEECDGRGEIKINTGKQIVDKNQIYTINNVGFNARDLDRLIKISELLNEDTLNIIQFSSLASAKPTLVKLGDLYILIMLINLEYSENTEKIDINLISL